MFEPILHDQGRRAKGTAWAPTVYGMHQAERRMSSGCTARSGHGYTFQGSYLRAWRSWRSAPSPARPRRPRVAARGTETVLVVEDRSAGPERRPPRCSNATGTTVLEAPGGGRAGHRDPVLGHQTPPPHGCRDAAGQRPRTPRPARDHAPRRPGDLHVRLHRTTPSPRHGVLEPGSAYVQKPFTPRTPSPARYGSCSTGERGTGTPPRRTHR